MLVNINTGFTIFSGPSLFNPNPSPATMDAAGESTSYIGKVYLEAGSGSKTISAAGGGRIMWQAGTVTFNDSGTTLRVGINDVGATGVEDGTHDVYKDLVGGTDVITASSPHFATMGTGTKTLNHGDVIAIVIEMVSRGGSDTVQANGSSPNGGFFGQGLFPYRANDTGAGPTKTAVGPVGAAIEFDDGTLGWIDPFCPIPSNATTTITFGSSSTPDEYAAVFKLPFKFTARAAIFNLGFIASTDTFDIVVYSDPEGTPAVVQTITVNPALVGATGYSSAYFHITQFTTPITFNPDTWYAVAVRPTSTNTIQIGHISLGSGNKKYKRALPFGENIKFSGRTNQTGAFTEVQDYFLPIFGLMISQAENGIKEQSSIFA